MQKSNNSNMLAQRYSNDFSVPLELALILAGRFPEYNEAKKFLFPELSNLYDPRGIPDLEVASMEIIKAINNGEGILIYGHDDPDGFTSAAIMYKTLMDLHRQNLGSVYVYPIVREKDGYVLNREVLKAYREQGVKLVLTVDFGISNQENFQIAESENLKLIVCDHHETELSEFSAPAVNPKRKDSQYPFRELAGVGVVFKLAQYLYQTAFHLTANEFYNLKKEFFSIVLIGTISDRVVLRDENRVFCAHGLKILDQLDEPWIRFLKQDSVMNLMQITEEIIPIIASAAYLDSNLGVGILVSKDEDYIAETVSKLRLVNVERRRIIESLFDEVVSAAKVFPGIVVSIIPISKQHYLGPVSARLRNYFRRTAVVIGFRQEKCFGELRSYCLDLYKMLSHMGRLFLDFGGHKKAAGFSILADNLDRFVEEAVSYVSNHTTETADDVCSPCLTSEVFLNKSDINIVAPLVPFGEGNPAPIMTDGVDIYTTNNSFNIIDIGLGA